jgi:LysM repeat protein
MPGTGLKIRLLLIAAFLAVIMITPDVIPLVHAQDNLLRDGGFENTTMKTVEYDASSGTRFSVSADWNGWYTTTPREASWQNQIPNGTGRNNAGFGFVLEGNRSAELSRGQATFTAALYQTITVPENANLVGSAWYVMDLSLNDNPNARARVGIDPRGGNNPFSSDVVWSSWGGNRIASQGFQQLTVNATAVGTQVTFYLYATQTVPSTQNGIFWDEASLKVGGPGGNAPSTSATTTSGATAAPAATPVPQTVPNVVPQGEQEDGSIIHTVQPGDTINSIAVAYRVSASDIIELNNLANPRLISVGQKLLVKEATSDSSASSDTADTETTDTTDEDTTEAQTAGSGGAEAAAEATAEETGGEEEPEPTNTPAPTATPRPTSPPAPVAVADSNNNLDLNSEVASLCVMIFDDANGDNTRQDSESSLSNGNVVLMKDGQEVDSFVTTDSPNPSCFEELEPGQYVLDASPPAGYTLLGSRSRPNLPVGQEVNVFFAAVDSDTVENIPAPEVDDTAADQSTVLNEETTPDEGNSALQFIGLAVFGLAALTLVGGIGLGLVLRNR